MNVQPYGDAASLISCPADDVAALAAALARYGEVVPGMESVAVLHDVGSHVPSAFSVHVQAPTIAREHHEFDVVYDGADLRAVADTTGLTAADVVVRHSSPTYEVAMIGFAPGFPYLRGLDPSLRIGRRATPRTTVPAGSVAIAGEWTGIYPMIAPGGWHLLGRTDRDLFDGSTPVGRSPALLAPGDSVRFRPVGAFANSDRRVNTFPEAAVSEIGGVEVLSAGHLTVQDLGRPGYGRYGVPHSGAADPLSLRLANRLVGNPHGAAVLEATLVGPTLRFLESTTVAIVGASCDVPGDRTIDVNIRDVLSVGRLSDGARCYIAVGGGFDVVPTLGSCSTDTLSGLGPNPVRIGDRLSLGGGKTTGSSVLRSARPRPRRRDHALVLRVVAGPHGDGSTLADHRFIVDPDSNRVGLRLRGPRLITGDGSLPSLAMVTGAVQLPPDGQPIVLMPDHGPTGGYPVVAVVISADLPVLAGLRPGDALTFEVVSLRDARTAWGAQQRWLATAIARLDRW